MEEPEDKAVRRAVREDSVSIFIAEGLDDVNDTFPSINSFPCSSMIVAVISRKELMGMESTKGEIVMVDAPTDWESPDSDTFTVMVFVIEGLSREERVMFVVPGALAVILRPFDSEISERETDEFESDVHLMEV